MEAMPVPSWFDPTTLLLLALFGLVTVVTAVCDIPRSDKPCLFLRLLCRIFHRRHWRTTKLGTVECHWCGEIFNRK
jgi:hypothetical protein